MKPVEFPFALLGLLVFIAFVPAIYYWTTSAPAFQSLSMEAKFIAGMTGPIFVLLYIGSWLEPG